MAQSPIAMEQLKQILQLYKDGIAIREIVRRTGVSRNSVRKYLSRLKETETGSDSSLAAAAYSDSNDLLALDAERLRQLTVHFSAAGSELSHTGVTRQLLWQEYQAQHPDGYSYSRYCHHLNEYLKNRDLAMHLEYQPSDMTMIDYAGKKMYYTDVHTGERIDCDVFIAILPFSGLIFCDPIHSQKTDDFAANINAMIRFYRGVTNTILCDNMKTAVKRVDRYEPQFTDICHHLSEHYATTFSATRPYSPRDKAMVERAVNIVYNHVYGPLRHQEFTSITHLRHAMLEQLTLLNDKPYKNTPFSRRYFFEQQEQAALKPLPSVPFVHKKVVQLTVQRNYHVQLSEDHRYYSVPYQYVGKKVKVFYDAITVEVYLNQDRIAVHPRRVHYHTAYVTLEEHMPPHHSRMKTIRGFNRDDLLEQAIRVGPATLQAATAMLQNSIYMEQNYKACFGMLMLQKKYGIERLEAACARILQGPRVSYTLIKNILERGLDKQTTLPVSKILPEHNNIRGKDHYQ
jgi:transposase